MARDIFDRPQELARGSGRRATWQTYRRAASAAMTPAAIDEHMTWVAWRAEALADEWLARGHVEDVKEGVTPLVCGSMIRFCLGERATDPGLAEALLDTEKALFRLFTAIIDWPPIIRAFLPREWHARRAVRRLDRMLGAGISRPGSGGVADRLRDNGLPDDDVVQVLRPTLLAALGMPAASLAWALVEVGRDPAEQEAAAQALDTCPHPGIPKRVEWLVKETLRLWPSGFVGRRATRDVNCAGWLIPAKTDVMVPMWAIHRNADSFPDSDTFDPGRWATVTPRPGEYIPFGGGSNRCFGARFGWMQMCTVLAVLLRRCRFTLVGEPRPADALSVLRPADCRLVVTAR